MSPQLACFSLFLDTLPLSPMLWYPVVVAQLLRSPSLPYRCAQSFHSTGLYTLHFHCLFLSDIQPNSPNWTFLFYVSAQSLALPNYTPLFSSHCRFHQYCCDILYTILLQNFLTFSRSAPTTAHPLHNKTMVILILKITVTNISQVFFRYLSVDHYFYVLFYITLYIQLESRRRMYYQS